MYQALQILSAAKWLGFCSLIDVFVLGMALGPLTRETA
jgi:uncharacterized paraquat-inducible protein A